MFPWVGSHAPSCGRQLLGLLRRVEYLPPQGVLLWRVYGTVSSAAVARVAGPRCLAGDPLLGCVPARLTSVVDVAPGDVCHGP